jgi:antitoxin component YwqK of YwqJK toxin-antitoxin module
MKQFLYIIIILTITSCKSQSTNNTKKDTMKTFNIETFNKNKIGNEYNFKLEDGTKINQQELPNNEYIERINPKNSYFQTLNRYYYSNKKLKSTVQLFPNDFLAGVMKEYDQFGNLTNETDYDKPYKYTWEDILKYIKQRKFDMNAYGFEVGRNVVDGKPVWSIIYNKSDEDMKLGVIGLDGITGEIFQESEIDYPLEE